MKAIYSSLLLTAALAGHFSMFRPPYWAWPVLMIGLGLAWGYAVRPRCEVRNEHHHN